MASGEARCPKSEARAFLIAVFVTQIIVIVFVSCFGEYGPHADATQAMHSYHPVYGGLDAKDNFLYTYGMFFVPVRLVTIGYFGLFLGECTCEVCEISAITLLFSRLFQRLLSVLVPLQVSACLRLVAVSVLSQLAMLLEALSRSAAEWKWPAISFGSCQFLLLGNL